MKDCPREKTCRWLIKEYFKLGKILIEFAAESWQWPQNWSLKKSQKKKKKGSS